MSDDDISEFDEFFSPENKALADRLYGPRKPNGPSERPSNVIEMRLAARERSDTAGIEGRALLSAINPAIWEGVLIPEREWCVPDYIPANTVTMLSGDGGQGKSLLRCN
jgi:hypothetical protein